MSRPVDAGSEDFAPVREAVERRLSDGSELGLSLCVVREGRVVLDLTAGWADESRTTPWTAESIAPVWSISKMIMNLAALALVDSGDLELDRPATAYWPELGAAGHGSITARQILDHSAGLPAWPATTSVDALLEWDTATESLLAQEAWWPAGTRTGYHLMSQGFLIGEVIRRITRRRPDEFVREVLVDPVDADFRFGVLPEDAARVVETVRPRGYEPDPPGSVATEVRTRPFVNLRISEDPRWRAAMVPAANGFGNARALALIQALVSHRGDHGGRRMSAATIEEIFVTRGVREDLVFRAPIRWGSGFALPDPETFPGVPEGSVCFWGGIGGALVVNDLDAAVTIAYVPNRLSFQRVPGRDYLRPCGNEAVDEYLRLIYDAFSPAAAGVS